MKFFVDISCDPRARFVDGMHTAIADSLRKMAAELEDGFIKGTVQGEAYNVKTPLITERLDPTAHLEVGNWGFQPEAHYLCRFCSFEFSRGLFEKVKECSQCGQPDHIKKLKDDTAVVDYFIKDAKVPSC